MTRLEIIYLLLFIACFGLGWSFFEVFKPREIPTFENYQDEKEMKCLLSTNCLNGKYYKEIPVGGGTRKLIDISLTSTPMTITMYTSMPEQTDSTPCIGANGKDMCLTWQALKPEANELWNGEVLCASNDFPLGTKVNVVLSPRFGYECTIVDRMNKRYKNRIDIYNGFDKECLDGYQPGDVCPQYAEAKKFGTQKVDVYLIK